MAEQSCRGTAEGIKLTQIEEIRVPDIGDFENIPVIEVLVAVGDSVSAEQSLVTLESDKASMDVPAPSAGVIKSLNVAVGDEVSEGALILSLEINGKHDSCHGGRVKFHRPYSSAHPIGRGTGA